MSCKGKNSKGGPCGMRPPSGKDWCISHAKTQGAGAAATSSTSEKPATKTASKAAPAGELHPLAMVGIGGVLGLLGLCTWLLWRPKSTAAAEPGSRRPLRAVG